jgi:hypothetical protein
MKSDRVAGNLSKLKQALKEMASEEPKRQPSMFEAIKDLLPEIRELKSRRFTDAEILERLNANGIRMSLGTFRQYLNRANRADDKNPLRTKSERKSESGLKRDVTRRPNPSETAAKPSGTQTETKMALGHKLNDDV